MGRIKDFVLGNPEKARDAQHRYFRNEITKTEAEIKELEEDIAALNAQLAKEQSNSSKAKLLEAHIEARQKVIESYRGYIKTLQNQLRS